MVVNEEQGLSAAVLFVLIVLRQPTLHASIRHIHTFMSIPSGDYDLHEEQQPLNPDVEGGTGIAQPV